VVKETSPTLRAYYIPNQPVFDARKSSVLPDAEQLWQPADIDSNAPRYRSFAVFSEIGRDSVRGAPIVLNPHCGGELGEGKK
jgi:hypothetical protein